MRTVLLYYYDPSRDRDETGNVLCSRSGLVPVERGIDSDDPVLDAIRLLIRGELTAEEIAHGLQSEFPLEGVVLEDAMLERGLLTLRFSDPFRRTVGGSCRVNILRLELEATAMQFPDVQRVRFEPEEVFQP